MTQGRLILLAFLAVMTTTVQAEVSRKGSRMILTQPGMPWRVSFPAEGFEIKVVRKDPLISQHYYFFVNESSGITVSFFVEPATRCHDSIACRDLYWQNPGPFIRNPVAVRKLKAGPFAAVEFILPEVQGVPLKQYNFSGHVVRDQYWLDMHLSRSLFDDRARSQIDQFVQAVRIEAVPPAEKPGKRPKNTKQLAPVAHLEAGLVE